MRSWGRAVAACGVASLALVFQIPPEAQAISSACPSKTKSTRIAHDTSCLPLCLCPTQPPQRRTSLHRARKATSQEIVTLRQWRRAMLSQGPWVGRGQQARLLDGWKIRLIDGDTFAYGAERVRIRGINTPEVSEPGGFEATQRLDLLLREGPVFVVPQTLDVYGRIVADVYVNDTNVAEVLREEGYIKQK